MCLDIFIIFDCELSDLVPSTAHEMSLGLG